MTILGQEHQAIGDNRQVAQADARQDAPDGVIEAVADDDRLDVMVSAEGDEIDETRIDVDGVEQMIEGRAAAMQQRHLAGHANGGADQARLPLGFDVAPARCRKGFQQHVGHVACRNRSIKSQYIRYAISRSAGRRFCPLHRKMHASRLSWDRRRPRPLFSRFSKQLLRLVAANERRRGHGSPAFFQIASYKFCSSRQEMSRRWPPSYSRL